MTKRPFGGTSRKRKRVSGFRVRMRSHTGRRVIKSRRKRGRDRIAVQIANGLTETNATQRSQNIQVHKKKFEKILWEANGLQNF